jgi:CDP-paratose 2-epimerase
MSVAVITGSFGLVGSEAASFFGSLGWDVIGIDNDMRRVFFGPEASTRAQERILKKQLGRRYIHYLVDVRDQATLARIFKKYAPAIRLVIHAAAQPSHDWAAQDPRTDFTINANGTLNLLETARSFAPSTVFIYVSTNKVYGDAPNRLPLIEKEKRFEIDPVHPYQDGIPEAMPIDRSLHSLFGVSKASADLLVQEYGRYFGMPTVSFRCGCITGHRQAGAALHGFLAYLAKCARSGESYVIYGTKGKQVRDNIHSLDLARAFYEFSKAPRPGEVYNIGGGRSCNCSVLEAIALCEGIARKKMDISYTEVPRKGDHLWWVTDNAKFLGHYPDWSITRDVPGLLREMIENHQ